LKSSTDEPYYQKKSHSRSSPPIKNSINMRLSIELENLIKKSSPLINNTELTEPRKNNPKTLSEHLASIDSRKALEVEHFLRACAIRLDLATVLDKP